MTDVEKGNQKTHAPRYIKPTPDAQTWLISLRDLTEWLDGIAVSMNLIAPTEKSGVLLFAEVEKSDEIKLQYIRPLMSFKNAFYHATERLFLIHKAGQEITLEENIAPVNTAIFGARPCDAQGIKNLNAIFLSPDPIDPAYVQRRENTIIIGMACNELGPYCFCTSVGVRPDDEDGMDIMIHEKENGYLIHATTIKGRALIPLTWEKSTEIHTMPSVVGQFPIPAKDKWPAHFRDDFWAKIGERCLSCRACSYVCPTCRCFVVRDEVLGPGEYERIRCWDSCMGENYRRVAGGHKPRFKKGERQRNRFFCKFYYFPEQYQLEDTTACTGCGRCIEVCPVGVDVTEVLTLMESQV